MFEVKSTDNSNGRIGSELFSVKSTANVTYTSKCVWLYLYAVRGETILVLGTASR